MLEKIKNLFRRNKMESKNKIDLTEVENIIMWYLASPKYREMENGNRYYKGQHDILNRERKIIGQGGGLEVVKNLPNNKIIDNQYSKLVKQKVNYIMSKKPTITSENETYNELLTQMFDKRFLKTLKNVATDVYNNGIGWLYTYIDGTGELKFKRLNSIEVIPVWENNEHTDLKYAARIYTVRQYDRSYYNDVHYCEIYSVDGYRKYLYKSNRLELLEEKPYIMINDSAYNWQKIPLICFRASELELPLLNRVKSLQDALNELKSDFMNNMQEDNRNTVLILKNYDGEELDEFRKNLATFGAVKVQSDGGVESLQIQVNASNYEIITNMIKKSIIENGGGFDSKSDTLGTNPNQLNIRSMYGEIDLEANDFETEFQASFEELIWFVANHLKNTGKGDFLNEKVEVVLNRDILVNESQAILDIKNSLGIISTETLLSQHPWVGNVQEEIERIEKEKSQLMEVENNYGAFGEHDHSHDKIDE
ncbi:phage portal protein [Leptotrichia shahii]|uniref:phage portal protein n=1 Tax=Leptotrichia shahii TaxID=157691 RepID=UPI0028D306F3|nr:phage portal protein [Leptotrichia shahii]